MYKQCAILFVLLLMFCRTIFAIDGVSIAGGWGEPNRLRGGRVATIWDWSKEWHLTNSTTLTGYWDASYAYWSTDGSVAGSSKDLWAVAVAPNLRLRPRDMQAHMFAPYLQVAVGPSYLSEDELGRREFGSHFAFQDIMGFGVMFGSRKQFDVSLNYLHYSNASLFPPNEGIDVSGLINFTYRF